MGAWIEISLFFPIIPDSYVAPHDGCVDWNMVARKNGKSTMVAPHDGCVDWNHVTTYPFMITSMSHPTMGAWIEIWNYIGDAEDFDVSHPTMGAWIEI